MGKKKPAKTTETAQAMPAINIEGTIVDLPISQLCRHPDNREPSESSVDEIAASLSSQGLLEPLTVRQIDESLYEIISGETRSLAARKLGWLIIRCKVIQADDAKALQLVAIANGLREDLNPIQQAKLIERLCADVANGGGGMTRADAALAVGLESASAASNAVGLLRLPEIWQQRIASGKLPATFGRTMLPACEVPSVFGFLEEEWHDFEESKEEDEDGFGCFHSRSSLEDAVSRALYLHTRPCDKKNTYSFDVAGLGWNERHKAMLFKLTPELEQKLDVKTIRIYGEDRLVALNVEAYDEIQIPLVKKAAKGKNAPIADGDDGEKKPLTPAEQKAKKKVAAEKLAKRVEEWRFDWIRSIVGSFLNANSASCSELSTSLAQQLAIYAAAGMDRDPLRSAVFDLMPKKKSDVTYGVTLDHVLSIPSDDTESMVCKVVATAVLNSVHWPRDVMEHAMRWLQQDLTSHWALLQSDQTAGAKERLRGFYSLFTSDQLNTLAKEPQVERVNSKREKVEILLEGVYLNLPKVLQEIEQPKAKSKKGA